MQRQSLGSPPVSNLYGHAAGVNSDAIPADDQKHNKNSPSSSSILNYDGQDDGKASKSSRYSFPSPSSLRQEKFVHAIPILTIICFLILYSFSHSPSRSAEINADEDDLVVPKKRNIEAIQNLKEIEKSYSLESRPPRRLADF